MVEYLRDRGIFYSGQVAVPLTSTIFNQEWLLIDTLGFLGEEG
jgi:hypothetical protein